MDIKSTTLFFLLTLSFALVNSQQQSTTDPDECSGRRIHIRSLPPQFNLALLSDCARYTPLSPNLCPYLSNHGLGPKTHNHTRSWHRTDPSLLELLFHTRLLLDYPCLSPDPLLSDAVFLPYYSSLHSLPYLFYPPLQNLSHQHGLDLHYFLQTNSPEIWRRRHGHDHFLVAAKPAWDLSEPLTNDPPIWGTSFLQLPEFFNVTVLTIESRPFPWQEIAIPYPTSFHPTTSALLDSWLKRVRRSRRTTLMLFAGGGAAGKLSSAPNIRRSIRTECESGNNNTVNKGSYYSRLCELVDCSDGICEHDPIRFMKPMLGADFCLQPPGDTPTRRSTFDGILAGCIPVFFEEWSARRQYVWHLPEGEYEEFSVFIPKEDVVFKGVRILDVLMGIPRGEVRRMREKVIELIPRVMYRKHGSSLGLKSVKDAFDIAVEGTLDRIKSRLQEVKLH